MDNEIITTAKKKEMYRLADDAIQRMAGNVGLNEGVIPEYMGALLLGIGMIGGAD